jgi:cysteine desulfurase
MRSSTLNVPGIIGMAEALGLANKEMNAENHRLREGTNDIFQRIEQAIPDVKLNGHPQKRLTHNLSLTIPGVEAKALIHLLKNKLSFSAGSACSTLKVEPSHVLKAIGLNDDATFQTIRLGFGQSTGDACTIADILIHGIKQLRNK